MPNTPASGANSLAVHSLLPTRDFFGMQNGACLDVVPRFLTMRAYALALTSLLLHFLWVQYRTSSCVVSNHSAGTTYATPIPSRCIFSFCASCGSLGIHLWTSLDVMSLLPTPCTRTSEAILFPRDSTLCGLGVDLRTGSHIVPHLSTRSTHPSAFRHAVTFTVRFMMLLFC